MNKWLIIWLTVACIPIANTCISAPITEYRSWTDIYSSDPFVARWCPECPTSEGAGWLVFENKKKRTFTFPFNRLSQADQNYISNLIRSNKEVSDAYEKAKETGRSPVTRMKDKSPGVILMTLVVFVVGAVIIGLKSLFK